MRTSLTSQSQTPKSAKKDNRIKALTSQFFSNLIKLETDFANKTYTVETLDELMESYGEAVEYYNSINDQIFSYFTFKIQDTLSKKKTFMLLLQENARAAAAKELQESQELQEALEAQEVTQETQELKDAQETQDGKDFFQITLSPLPLTAQNSSTSNSPAASPDRARLSAGYGGSRSVDASPISPNKGRVSFAPVITTSHVIMETMGDESSDEDDEDKKIKQKRKATAGKKHAAPRKSISAIKDMNQKLFNLQMKLQKEKANQKLNMNAVLDAFGSSAQLNDQIVRGDISQQKSRIASKVARRKKENFMNYTQSQSSAGGFLLAFSENLTIENVLKQLDDEDSLQGTSNVNVDQNISGNGASTFNQEAIKESQEIEKPVAETDASSEKLEIAS